MTFERKWPRVKYKYEDDTTQRLEDVKLPKVLIRTEIFSYKRISPDGTIVETAIVAIVIFRNIIAEITYIYVKVGSKQISLITRNLTPAVPMPSVVPQTEPAPATVVALTPEILFVIGTEVKVGVIVLATSKY